MNDTSHYLYTNGSECLQIPYAEYKSLIAELGEAQRLEIAKSTVLADLDKFLSGGSVAVPKQSSKPQVKLPEEVRTPQKKESESEKVSVEFSAEKPKPIKKQSSSKGREATAKLPPFKKEIADHFNKFDESGRLFNVFTQYYTCLNDVCGGTVRVTIKDGFCSLWNYDEWEEFAFVDIFEDLLRITIDPRYTDRLKSLSLCEAPRLISSRRNVICVKVGDLNQVVLDTLVKAFSEVGIKSK